MATEAADNAHVEMQREKQQHQTEEVDSGRASDSRGFLLSGPAHTPTYLTRALSRGLSRNSLTQKHPIERRAQLQEQQQTIRSLVAMREKERKRVARLLIDPRTSNFVGWWDVVTAFALLFTALFTPFELSFLGTAELLSMRFALNRLIDAIFTFDLGMQFFVMFPQQKSVYDSVYWVDDLKVIRRHYLLGWFTLDLVSILPFWVFDYTSGCSSDMSSTNLLRLVRLLRCIKMIRLVRASRLVKRWQAKVPMSHVTMSMTKCLIAIAFFGHWFACVWALQTSFADSRLDTWLANSDFHQWCVPTPEFDSSVPPDGCNATGDAASQTRYVDSGVCDGPGAIYTASLYLAIVTITSVGYGDITATNVSETVILTILMTSSALMWGLVIGTFSGIFSTMNPSETAFRNVMDELNHFMRNYGFNPDMQRRVREYFYQSRHLQAAKSHTALLEMMSPKLQGEVTLLCNQKWIEQVWFFRGCEENFLVQVALSMTPAVYVPDETMPPGNLYVLHSGLILYGGRVLAAGQSWGDDMLITRLDLQSHFSALALSYANVFKISCTNLQRIAAPFPAVLKRLRFCAARLALRREFIKIAKARLMATGGSSSNTRLRKQLTSSSLGGSRNEANCNEVHTPGPGTSVGLRIQPGRPGPPNVVDARVAKVEGRLESMDAKLDAVQAQLALLVRALALTPTLDVPMVVATVTHSPAREPQRKPGLSLAS